MGDDLDLLERFETEKYREIACYSSSYISNRMLINGTIKEFPCQANLLSKELEPAWKLAKATTELDGRVCSMYAGQLE